jgi:hypothetical protein
VRFRAGYEVSCSDAQGGWKGRPRSALPGRQEVEVEAHDAGFAGGIVFALGRRARNLGEGVVVAFFASGRWARNLG